MLSAAKLSSRAIFVLSSATVQLAAHCLLAEAACLLLPQLACHVCVCVLNTWLAKGIMEKLKMRPWACLLLSWRSTITRLTSIKHCLKTWFVIVSCCDTHSLLCCWLLKTIHKPILQMANHLSEI